MHLERLKKHEAWVYNTLEYGLWRGGEVILSLVLIKTLSLDQFGLVTLVQAFVIPSLLFFLGPERTIYQDFSEWPTLTQKTLSLRLGFFRTFSWIKLLFAILFCVLFATFFSYLDRGPFKEIFFWGVWAYAVALSSHIASGDREFLRLTGEYQELLKVAILSRGSFLVCIGIGYFTKNFYWMAIFSWLLLIFWGFYVQRIVTQTLIRFCQKNESIPKKENLNTSFRDQLKTSFTGFAIWEHFTSIFYSWLHNLDLFWGSFFSIPTERLGMYGTLTKYSNLTSFVSEAVHQVFRVRLGQGKIEIQPSQVRGWVIKTIFTLCGVALGLWFLAPFALGFLGWMNWSVDLRLKALEILPWILAGTILRYSAGPIVSFLLIRRNAKNFFIKNLIPLWIGCSFSSIGLVYYLSNLEGMAFCNFFIGLIAFLGCFLLIKK